MLSSGLDVLGHTWPEEGPFGAKSHPGDALMSGMKRRQYTRSKCRRDDGASAV